MSSSAHNTPAKSPILQTQDPPDTEAKSPPDSTKRQSSPKDKLEKLVRDFIEEQKLAAIKRAEMLEAFLNETTDVRDIEFAARFSFRMKQIKEGKTPQK